MSRPLGPLLLKSCRVWEWFNPKTFQGLHFLFSGELIWSIDIWVICPWNKFGKKRSVELSQSFVQSRFSPNWIFDTFQKVLLASEKNQDSLGQFFYFITYGLWHFNIAYQSVFVHRERLNKMKIKFSLSFM